MFTTVLTRFLLYVIVYVLKAWHHPQSSQAWLRSKADIISDALLVITTRSLRQSASAALDCHACLCWTGSLPLEIGFMTLFG